MHAGEIGLSTATDSEIIEFARSRDMIVVTLDADFHALLALSGAEQPSIVRVRIEGLRAESLAILLTNVLTTCAEDLQRGAMVAVTEHGVRVRGLPLVR